MNFTEWWEEHSKDYEQIGVNKVVAHSIWNAALECMMENIEKAINGN